MRPPNRDGDRLGTGEIYALVEEFTESTKRWWSTSRMVRGTGWLILFVTTTGDAAIDDALPERTV